MKINQTKFDLHQEIVNATSDEGTHQLQSNISSILNLDGDIDGMLGVHCSEKAAKEITGSFLGMEFDELDNDVKDAIGEIANMVAGNLKISFSKIQTDVRLAIPTTVVEDSYNLDGFEGFTGMVVPFYIDQKCPFWIELKYILNS